MYGRPLNVIMNIKKVCACIGLKVVFGNCVAKNRVHSNVSKLIQQFLNPAYNIEDLRYPTGFCNSCYNTVNEHKNGKFKRTMTVAKVWLNRPS